jgi:hypothetical protein
VIWMIGDGGAFGLHVFPDVSHRLVAQSTLSNYDGGSKLESGIQ